MKTLNQVRETALKQIAEINDRIGNHGFGPDSRHTAMLIDSRQFYETVLAMCDRLDSSPVAVAVDSRNYSED